MYAAVASGRYRTLTEAEGYVTKLLGVINSPLILHAVLVRVWLPHVDGRQPSQTRAHSEPTRAVTTAMDTPRAPEPVVDPSLMQRR